MIPIATYRLQFRNGMTFGRACSLIPHLKELGISHLYASPIFTAATGSTHGYDVVNCNEIDPALGGQQGFNRLHAELLKHGMGIILDIVPNHMAASLENPWWYDVIEWGQRSPYSGHFDIDWRSKLSLPVLDRPFTQLVKTGQVALVLADDHVIAIEAAGGKYPLSPQSYAVVFETLESPVGSQLILAATEATPRGTASFHARINNVLSTPSARNVTLSFLEHLSSDEKMMERIHDAQPWHLIPWRDASRHLNYRRFFDINGLAGLRVEDPGVFEDVHQLAFKLIDAGQIDGLRIDHIDGLADPTDYLARLRDRIGKDKYLIVEKILQHNETLPAEWPVDGTTGYEFIAAAADVFVDPAGWSALGDAYASTRDEPLDIGAEKRRAKLQLLRQNFQTELSVLAALAAKLSEGTSGGQNPEAFEAAIAELIAAFPVYRTYGTRGGMTDHDAELIDDVATAASKANLASDPETLWQVVTLLKRRDDDRSWELRKRFQQLSGPVMAKAVEDTLFYRHNQLLGLNEVGGELTPDTAGAQHFHQLMVQRVASRDHSLSATSTHDTKRGEDARALLYSLSDAPQRWIDGFQRWRQMNVALRQTECAVPDASDEWFIYQGLAGVWPSRTSGAGGWSQFQSRFAQYLEKAMREAKLHTSWHEVNAPYEDAMQKFVAKILGDARSSFVKDFETTLRPFEDAGRIKSLAQTLMKITAPGVPDFYQGTELWDYSLVDPDNRRPLSENVISARTDGSAVTIAKREIIIRALEFRSKNLTLFELGEYRALEIKGGHHGKYFAFLREYQEAIAITLVTVSPLAEGSAPVILDVPPQCHARRFTDIISGKTGIEAGREVAEILAESPVALLVSI
ncbi:malto-oligosyltrehalose synthase [Phyllobacterium endophyticum]|uniref:malto-oligosyltrehalose synthase n=1 Tax=Phyllobacterium endophyticum TaxID=1149773 RepID=UPI0011C8E3F2|nr:malto-oligosyltrehalose synthase [Phyllobacterium endophyticum]TXR47260.1 malto-oligosyltrehalose synthase [Phyllobacterium endophyticum]